MRPEPRRRAPGVGRHSGRKDHIDRGRYDGETEQARPTSQATSRRRCDHHRQPGGGHAHIRWGFSSKDGHITERNLVVSWYNYTTDGEGDTIDLFPMFAVTHTSAWWSP